MVLPSVLKGAFGVGGSYGRGVMICRSGEHYTGPWGPPALYALEGVSVGFQLGGQATDFVLLVMNPRGARSLLSSKVKLGADASAAAGPKGRTAEGATDVVMSAEILSYSRNKGLFAGISLEGSTLRSDGSANEKLYGQKLTARETLSSTKSPFRLARRSWCRCWIRNRPRTNRIRNRWSNARVPDLAQQTGLASLRFGKGTAPSRAASAPHGEGFSPCGPASAQLPIMTRERKHKDEEHPVRCPWARSDLAIPYHDGEWGVPVHDDRTLFEFLILEGAQAGLSWATILKKREAYRKAFRNFEAAKSRASARSKPRVDGQPGHRAKPPQNRRGGKKRPSISRSPKGVRLLRRLHLAIHRRPPLANPPPHPAGCPGPHPPIRRHEQGLEAPRLHLRRYHHLLRLHAGHGHGERPRRGMFPLQDTGRALAPWSRLNPRRHDSSRILLRARPDRFG